MVHQLCGALFGGAEVKDVEASLFIYENLCMREKYEKGKGASDFGFFRGELRLVYRSKLISGWFISEDRNCYENVCQWSVKQYKISVYRYNQIEVGIAACLNFTDLEMSLECLDSLC